jgi:broad specificity phosphatase PhoE
MAEGFDTLILVRHGKPALSRKVRLTGPGFRAWWVKYDEGGLKVPQRAPKRVGEWAKTADVVLSSPLRRALESAEIAADRAPDALLPELVEAALPSPNLGPLTFRPKTWGTIARIIWWLGYSDGMESRSEARARAEAACDALEAYAAGGKTVYVQGHGWFNRMVKGSLMKRGWKLKSQNGDLHWSRRRLVRPTRKDEV